MKRAMAGDTEGANAAVTAIGIILAVTAILWAFALWPLPGDTPTWVFRTRTACFGSVSTGLPDASGWLVLTLQPALMMGILVAGWGSALATGVRRLWAGVPGRASLAVTALAIVVGGVLAGWRVTNATPPDDAFAVPDESVPSTYPRLDRAAPPLRLTDQSGQMLDLAQLRGRAVLITFAYAHCTTVCPVVIQDVREARRLLPDLDPAVIVVTLDPERDVPSRLPAIAQQWRLGTNEFAVSGTVQDVEATLNGWNVARSRDPITGEVVHPRLVYLIDGAGQVTYVTSGSVQMIVELARRL